MQKIATIAAIALAYLAIHCHRGGAAFPRPDNAGCLVMHCSADEVAEAQRELSRVDGGHLPEHLEGGVLLDGVVERSLGEDDVGQPRWLITPQRVFVGHEQVPREGLIVASPARRYCGVSLEVGSAYRVFAVELKGRFYLWEMTVVRLP
jgi:hypothetical protein